MKVEVEVFFVYVIREGRFVPGHQSLSKESAFNIAESYIRMGRLASVGRKMVKVKCPKIGGVTDTC